MCKLHSPTAITVSNNGTIYITTTEETTAIYKIEADAGIRFNSTSASSLVSTTSRITNQKFSGNGSYQLCPEHLCPIQVSFGDLELAPLDPAGYTRRTVDFIIEDKYNLGTFFLNWGHAIVKYTPGQPLERFLGNMSQIEKRYTAGNSSTAEFSLISEVVQFNRTIMLIGDYLNHCVREYNFETDEVTQLVGKCGRDNGPAMPLNEGEVLPGDSHYMTGIMSFVLLKTRSLLLTIDYGYLRISEYNFNTKMVRLFGKKMQDKIPKPYIMLANQAETELYVVHSYGLSRVNLDTLEVTLVVGENVNDAEEMDQPIVTGSFADAKVGLIASLQWLVQDELLVAHGIKTNQAIMFLDLKGKQLYTACEGTVPLTIAIFTLPMICTHHTNDI